MMGCVGKWEEERWIVRGLGDEWMVDAGRQGGRDCMDG